MEVKSPGRLHGAAKASVIADLLYQHVLDMERFKKTGCVAPCNSLRPKRAREAFSFVARGPRYFTRSAVVGALQILISRYSIEVPTLPGHSVQDWIGMQAKSLHYLLKRAVKNSWNREYVESWGQQSPAAMDNDETQMWHVDWANED